MDLRGGIQTRFHGETNVIDHANECLSCEASNSDRSRCLKTNGTGNDGRRSGLAEGRKESSGPSRREKMHRKGSVGDQGVYDQAPEH